MTKKSEPIEAEIVGKNPQKSYEKSKQSSHKKPANDGQKYRSSSRQPSPANLVRLNKHTLLIGTIIAILIITAIIILLIKILAWLLPIIIIIVVVLLIYRIIRRG
jgi:Flp pilus assembly protein TadB